MPKEGYSVITIPVQTHEKARSRYLQKIKTGEIQNSKSFSRFVNDMIMDRIEADENLSLMAPFMQKVGLQDNSIMIKDNKVNRIAEIQIRGKEILCLYCNKKDCVHVGFSYAIPEVYRIMILQKSTRG